MAAAKKPTKAQRALLEKAAANDLGGSVWIADAAGLNVARNCNRSGWGTCVVARRANGSTGHKFYICDAGRAVIGKDGP